MKSVGLIKIIKLPIFIGAFVPMLALATGILLINQSQQYRSSANSDKTPLQVKVGNITDQSITVGWVTTGSISGTIMYGYNRSQLDKIAVDARDTKAKTQSAFSNHLVLIDNLLSNTEVFFKILSSGVEFDNQGQPFLVKTSMKMTPTDSDIAQGRVLNPDNSPADGALVYLSLANTIPQITLTDDDGRWMIPLSTARLTDLSGLSIYDRNSQVIDLIAIAGQQTANASTTTKNDNPTPDIVLGQTYNFVGQSTPTGNQVQSPTPGTTEQLQIIYPAASEKVSSQVPEFIGSGPAGEKLEITIHSDEQISGKTTVGSDQSWRWSPTTPLSPGEHTVTVSYTDKDGFVKKVTKSFIVTTAQAAENDFLPSFTATGSGRQATPIPTRIPTTMLQPTATPTATMPTPSPTESDSAPTPTATTTPIERTTIPENQGEVPTSGNWVTTVVVGGVGLLVVIVGLAFLIF